MAVIFDIDHEAGNLSEYNSTVTDSGDLSAHADAALAGTGYGLNCLIDGTGSIYGQLTLSSTYTDFRFRFYFDPNSLTMGQYEAFHVAFIYTSASPWSVARIAYTATGELVFEPFNDPGNLSPNYAAITDAPHYIEVYGHRAATNVSADGTYEWWVDGVSKSIWTGVDNYDLFAMFQLFRIGAVNGVDAGTSGTIYLDELVIRDDSTEIGPVEEGGGSIKIDRGIQLGIARGMYKRMVPGGGTYP